eukprot:scaffold155762_cov39-Tisochrysis_lutea.AAC.2
MVPTYQRQSAWRLARRVHAALGCMTCEACDPRRARGSQGARTEAARGLRDPSAWVAVGCTPPCTNTRSSTRTVSGLVASQRPSCVSGPTPSRYAACQRASSKATSCLSSLGTCRVIDVLPDGVIRTDRGSYPPFAYSLSKASNSSSETLCMFASWPGLALPLLR